MERTLLSEEGRVIEWRGNRLCDCEIVVIQIVVILWQPMACCPLRAGDNIHFVSNTIADATNRPPCARRWHLCHIAATMTLFGYSLQPIKGHIILGASISAAIKETTTSC